MMYAALFLLFLLGLIVLSVRLSWLFIANGLYGIRSSKAKISRTRNKIVAVVYVHNHSSSLESVLTALSTVRQIRSILIVNNASSDDSRHYIDSFQARSSEPVRVLHRRNFTTWNDSIAQGLKKVSLRSTDSLLLLSGHHVLNQQAVKTIPTIHPQTPLFEKED